MRYEIHKLADKADPSWPVRFDVVKYKRNMDGDLFSLNQLIGTFKTEYLAREFIEKLIDREVDYEVVASYETNMQLIRQSDHALPAWETRNLLKEDVDNRS